ncbi:hypothetical protein TNCV_3586681 [Trichonephila clavipes]|nr:hypothetical protein TNCV_3586681 [Trichonephila clavipes]
MIVQRNWSSIHCLQEGGNRCLAVVQQDASQESSSPKGFRAASGRSFLIDECRIRIFQRLHRQLRETRSFYVTRHEAGRRRAVRSPRLKKHFERRT